MIIPVFVTMLLGLLVSKGCSSTKPRVLQKLNWERLCWLKMARVKLRGCRGNLLFIGSINI